MFKTIAKFISLDKGGVTLERANGKRTTMELSVLRQEDQNHVKGQLEAKPELPKSEKE